MSGARDCDALPEVDAAVLTAHPLPRLNGETDKDERGRVLVVAGGREVPGAAILAAEAALRVGAGKLQMAATAAYALPLAMRLPEARVITGAGEDELGPEAEAQLAEPAARCDAVIIGPGMLDEAGASQLAERLMAATERTAFVIDAAALTGLAGRPAGAGAGRLVMTPHAGEMAALSGQDKAEVAANPLQVARRIAGERHAVVTLKGRDTCIAAPDGRAWLHRSGSPGLATSGSGDVLAGVIGGLLARGADPATAALWGVFLHGRAGARLAESVGPLGFLARELSRQIPGLLAELAG